MAEPKDEIDAVISWVDGDDPEHREKRQEALEKIDSNEKHTLPSGADATRFTDNNEIKYCIHSLLKFAPWLRNIYIVTDGQTPPFLTEEFRRKHNIIIVDHTDIFRSYEWALPTFNTRTIETALWRIPGIAPRFIYLNDDFVLTSEVSQRDFFQGDDTVLRGSWKNLRKYNSLRMGLNNYFSRITQKWFGITRSMHTLLQMRSAELAGFTKHYFHIPHVPHPIKTENLQSFFDENPEHFEQNIQYPFRSTDQFSAIFLASHLDIKNNQSTLMGTEHYLMLHGEADISLVLNQKLKKIQKGEVTFTCIQAMEKFKTEQKQAIESVMEELLLL